MIDLLPRKLDKKIEKLMKTLLFLFSFLPE